MKIVRPKPKLAQTAKFWSYTRPEGNGCLVWTRSRQRRGYGLTRLIFGYTRLAHRIAWEITYGPIPIGLCVLHHCDNPPCVEPRHLFLGTQHDNVRDRDAKGHTAHNVNPSYGEANGRALVTWPIVRHMRSRYAAGDSTRRIAQAFHYTLSLVENAIYGKHWPDEHWTRYLEARRAAREGLHPNAKLTRAQAADLRHQYATGTVTKAALARAFGVHEYAIGKILAGINYRLKEPTPWPA